MTWKNLRLATTAFVALIVVAFLLAQQPRGHDEWFKRIDKNNDGKLSRDELPGALFDRLDANKDGFVTEDELKALWKAK